MVPPHEMTTASDGKGGTDGTFCARCSEYLGEHRGEEIEAVEIKPMKLKDAAGRVHTFHFCYNPLPRNLEAYELKKGIPAGYHFQVMAEDDEPHAALVGRLLARLRRALARQHLRRCDMSDSGFSIVGDVVRGRIEWDEKREHEGRYPRVVIDGREFSWDGFGAMLMTFEGWGFKLSIIDNSEEDE